MLRHSGRAICLALAKPYKQGRRCHPNSLAIKSSFLIVLTFAVGFDYLIKQRKALGYDGKGENVQGLRRESLRGGN